LGSKAALTAPESDFSFTSESRHNSDIAGGPFRAITGSQLIYRSLRRRILHAKASRLYKQEAREVLVQPQYGTDRILGVCFWLTGKSKRNLINALK